MDFVNTVILPGLIAGGGYALIAMGFGVLFRTTGVLNFAHGVLVMVGPTALLVAMQKWHVAIGLAWIIAVVAVLLFGLVEERIAIRPFIQSTTALPWVLTTLGASVIFAELLAIPFDGQRMPFPHGFSTRPQDLAGLRLSANDIATVLAPFVVVGVLELLYRRTSVGRQLRAVAEDADGAAAIGVSKRRMSRLAAGLAAIVALITGILLAPVQLVNPALGISFTFTGFVAATMGGLGSLTGALLGGFVVGMLGQLGAVYVGSLYVNTTLFVALIAVYLVRPFGIFGRPPVRSV